MKSKIIITCILVGFIITLFAIFNFKCPYSFKENVLYTQNDVSGYNENEKENNNLVNRNEAIKTARYYIEDILGNDLESANNKMYVNLYKNDSGAESYYWNISWSSPTLSCGIEINTINKHNLKVKLCFDEEEYIYYLVTKDKIYKPYKPDNLEYGKQLKELSMILDNIFKIE